MRARPARNVSHSTPFLTRTLTLSLPLTLTLTLALTLTLKVAMLNEQFDGAVAEKGELEAKANQCQTRLSNAGKLLGGLGGEEARWKTTVEALVS